MTAALNVEGIGKSFNKYTREIHRLLSWLGVPVPSVQHKWVLHDISFALQPGEAVGLIGLNGAGKSTLLKIVTGTLKASKGQIQINGRVAAILELGMGFHPDLTGRQNVYHVAGLMGFSQEQINGFIDAVHAFSEVGDYFELPVRVYSSGMQARLAFAVATAERPEILIVDEALSVGDAYFQHKSFDRIRQFTRQGTTLLLVSHDKQAIQSICNRAILLDGGTIAMEGEPDAVMDYYNALLAAHQDQQIIADPQSRGALLSGTGEVEFIHHHLCDDQGNPVEVVDVGQVVRLNVSAHAYLDIPDLVLGFLIKDRYGQDVFGTNTRLLDDIFYDIKAGAELSWSFVFPANIGPGTYSITLALHSIVGHIECNYAWQERALMFEIVNRSQAEFAGVAWLDAHLESKQRHE
ncbi:ABC transporter ATP-binding protein [Pseudomonas putida]|uniref:ABC transporter ATP-binding protein n=1 Tax=Pseudomonas TaxID=286 RepID=UPI00062A4A81|nr:MULTISPECIES: ABC transporter ATP-binding protein [Pseudomonas]KAF1307430.1 sugar ABC transporter ATP-binding protein [Pseudomonas sp. SG-MS2]